MAKNPSYPPCFRQTTASPLEPPARPSPTSAEPSPNIPMVDLDQLDPAHLVEACKEWGLFRLGNHGLPADLSAQLHEEAAMFMGLPFEEKQAHFQAQGPVPAYFWGTPALTQNLKNMNWLEGLEVSLGSAQYDAVDAWPLRALVEEYGKHMARIARRLFDAVAPELKLDSNQLASYLSENDATLRVYRYPMCPNASDYFGMDAHTDSSVLSILNQDLVGGFQVFHGGRWFDVAPADGTLLVILGDVMQAISNDEYKSVQHRVMANSSKERISLGYFAFPAEDGVIRSPNYKPFTYNDFKAQVQQDVKAFGVKVGLEKFKIKDSS